MPGLGFDTTLAEPFLISGQTRGKLGRATTQMELIGEARAEQGSVGRKEALRVFGVAPHRSGSQERDEFLHGEVGLAQDALEDRLREVFIVQGNRDAKLALHPMEEPGVAAG